MEKWYLVETPDGAEISFGSPNSETGLTLTGGKKVHQIACAQYLIRLHERAEAKLLNPKPKKKSRRYWRREARQIHKVFGEAIKDLKVMVKIAEEQRESLVTYEDNLRIAIEQNGLLFSQLNKVRHILKYGREDMSNDIYFQIASTLNPEDWDDDSG